MSGRPTGVARRHGSHILALLTAVLPLTATAQIADASVIVAGGRHRLGAQPASLLPHCERVTALDPSPQLLDLARRRAETALPVVQLVQGNAEDLPLERGSIDCITMTWTLCSIGDVNRALEEFRRVLKPGGTVFCAEHGRAPDATVRRWQDRLTPVWRRCAGNCHLNRPTTGLFERGCFTFERLKTGYARSKTLRLHV